MLGSPFSFTLLSETRIMTDVKKEFKAREVSLLFVVIVAAWLLVSLFVVAVITKRTNTHVPPDPARLAHGESKEIVCFSSVPLKYELKDENQPPFRYRLDGDTLYIDGGDLGFSITKLSPGTVCFFDAGVKGEYEALNQIRQSGVVRIRS